MLFLTPALTAYLLFLFALMGLCAGSFINAWAWRVVHGERIEKGRSHCAVCGHTLSALDLVPLLSYLFLRGRCRYCGAKIAPRYPAAEAVTGLVFVSLLLRYDVSLPLLRLLLLGCVLLLLSLVDADTRELPDGPVLAAGLLALLRIPAEGLAAVPDALLGGFALAGPLLAVVLIADRVLGRESMGGGDIKLLFVLGLHFGPALTLLLLILACFFGLLVPLLCKSLPLGAGSGSPSPSRTSSVPPPPAGEALAGERTERADLDTAGDEGFPFGPSLALAAWVTALFGQWILDRYLGLFF